VTEAEDINKSQALWEAMLVMKLQLPCCFFFGTSFNSKKDILKKALGCAYSVIFYWKSDPNGIAFYQKSPSFRELFPSI